MLYVRQRRVNKTYLFSAIMEFTDESEIDHKQVTENVVNGRRSEQGPRHEGSCTSTERHSQSSGT